jgi:hypothetical protein
VFTLHIHYRGSELQKGLTYADLCLRERPNVGDIVVTESGVRIKVKDIFWDMGDYLEAFGERVDD